LPNIPQGDLTVAVRRQHHQARILRGPDGVHRVGLERERQVEEAAHTRPHGLRVVDVDGVTGQHDRVRPEGVRGTDQGAGVAGIADVRGDRDQPGPRGGAGGRGEGIGERNVEERAHRDDPGRGHAVAERGQRAVVNVRRAWRGGDQRGVLLAGGGRREDLDDRLSLERTLHGLGSVDQEQPPFGAGRTAAELARLLDPGVPRRQGHAHGRGLRTPWAR
jgi:hypothetical protein